MRTSLPHKGPQVSGTLRAPGSAVPVPSTHIGKVDPKPVVAKKGKDRLFSIDSAIVVPHS